MSDDNVISSSTGVKQRCVAQQSTAAHSPICSPRAGMQSHVWSGQTADAAIGAVHCKWCSDGDMQNTPISVARQISHYSSLFHPFTMVIFCVCAPLSPQLHHISNLWEKRTTQTNTPKISFLSVVSKSAYDICIRSVCARMYWSGALIEQELGEWWRRCVAKFGSTNWISTCFAMTGRGQWCSVTWW